jgi:hypothetical protein
MTKRKQSPSTLTPERALAVAIATTRAAAQLPPDMHTTDAPGMVELLRTMGFELRPIRHCC